MKIELLCSSGVALETATSMLLIDVPNGDSPPFYRLPDGVWERMLRRTPPYDKACGFCFTHDHPDHFDRGRVEAYLNLWPHTPVFLPGETTKAGKVHMGPFTVEYSRIDHAPIPGAPPHTVLWVEADGKAVYLAGDAVLDPETHRAFLRGRRADAAVWNSMFLSRPETRRLLHETSDRNLICHMPAESPDSGGLWRKLEMNFQRNGAELNGVTVGRTYPTELTI